MFISLLSVYFLISYMELVGGWFSHQVGVMHACSTSLMGSVIITSNDTLIECVCSLITKTL